MPHDGPVPIKTDGDHLVTTVERVRVAMARQWWAYVPGASWRHPTRPESRHDGLDRHPVIHVAFEDVEAYAT